MSLPSYIRTEWKGRGHAALKFMNFNCKLCEEEQKDCKKKNTALTTTENDPQSTSAKTDSIVECSHANLVECLVSTFNVWEFEEELNPEEPHPHTDVELQQKIAPLSKETLPPTIDNETWKMWLQYWEEWKDVFINLSWVQRFKNLSSPETQDWFKNYSDNYPQVLSFVSYCKDIKLEKEESTNKLGKKSLSYDDFEDSDVRNIIDELYEEFSCKRHWVHLRLFLKDSNFELNDELQHFFFSHGIDEELPEISLDMVELCGTVQSLTDGQSCESDYRSLSDQLCKEKAEDSSTLNEVCDTSSGYVEDTEEPSSTNQITDSEPDEAVIVDSLLEGEGCSLGAKPEEQLLSSGEENSEMLEQITSQPESCIVMKTQENEVDSLILKGNQSVSSKHDSSVIKSQKETKKGRASKPASKSKERSSCGVVWALKHIKQLGEEAKSSQSDNSSHTFVFGTCESTTKDHHLSKTDRSDSSPLIDPVRTHLKRKHEELEDASQIPPIKPNGDQRIVKPFSNLIVRALGSTLIHCQHLVRNFSRGIFRVIMAMVGIIPFQRRTPWYAAFPFSIPIQWWNRRCEKEETLIQKRMKRTEKNLMKLKNLFKPTIRHFPDWPLLFSESFYLNQVTKYNNSREVHENLIRLSRVDNPSKSSQTDLRSGLYVMYMSEEDIDYVLEGMVELLPVVAKEGPLHRTVTLFDETGMPQDVIKVPVDGGKMRCMLEDDYKQESSSENWTPESPLDHVKESNCEDWLYSSNVQFDDEGNPVTLPVTHQQTPHTLHSKINKVLRNTRLTRFTKDDVYTMPEDIPKDVLKYWRQRFRLFLRYDEGIKLDHESWFSVTPEMIAAHQAERCACDTIVDAFCGAGGNAIQMAATCNSVIAIDIDPAKIALAQHNATIYGVEDRIQFIQGDFFLLANQLKADVVYLAPPWGGMEYLQKSIYDIFSLGGQMNGRKVFEAAQKITPNIAVYLPRNSNLFQIIELACPDGKVDVEFSHISNKRKGLTAYYGDLCDFPTAEEDVEI